MKMNNLKFLGEACRTTPVNLRLLCNELTLLINACDEAKKWRNQAGLPHGDKYEAMSDRLRILSDELDKRIEAKCDVLALIHKNK